MAPPQPCWSSWALSAWSWLVPGQPPPSCLRGFRIAEPGPASASLSDPLSLCRCPRLLSISTSPSVSVSLSLLSVLLPPGPSV